MLTLGRPKFTHILADERDTNCVISSHQGMQNVTTARLTLGKLVRDPQTAVWQNRDVAVLRYESPKNAFHNKPASAVMGREILGNAVLISAKHITAEDIDRFMNPRQNTWAGLARKLPATLELSDEIKARRNQEALEREQQWLEFYANKRAARRANSDHDDQDEPDEQAAADWAEWQAQQDFCDAIEKDISE